MSAPSQTAAIELAQLEVGYGAVRVLEGLDLSLGAKRTHVLLGASGCGKSTLLRSLVGVVVPTKGAAWVMGNRVEPADTPGQRAANRLIGFMVQDAGLYPHLTVAENITLPAQLANWDSVATAQRLAELEQLVSMSSDFRSRFPDALSGGQRQRVALMRALFLDPPLLLLDEPFSSLDPMTRVGLQEQMKTLFARLNKTVVLVTHDIPEAAFFADTISLLENGRLLQHGTADAVLSNPGSQWVRDFMSASVPRWRSVLSLMAGTSR